MSRDRKILVGVVVVAFLAAVALVVFGARASASPWLQQTAKFGSEPCAEGWSESWAEWANGPVCTREVEDPSCSYTPCAAAPVSTPAPTLPPWPSGRWLQYAGNVRAQSNPPGSGYTIVSSPFNACLWSQARTTTSPDVTVSDLSPNNWVELHNTGVAEVTGIVVEVLCD